VSRPQAPYPLYRRSSIEWLGEVPADWVVTTLKHGYSVTLGKMLQPDFKSAADDFLPYLRAANIQWWGVDTTSIKSMWLSPRERVALKLEEGDLLVSEGGDVGRCCQWNKELPDCYFQNSINRVRSIGRNSNRFLYYWLLSLKEKGYVDVICNKSTIAHFTAEKLEQIPIPMPVPKDQAQIAKFLDYETAKIDGLIEKQQQLIALLKEKRQAVISHAVTKGLNPDAPMRDSGVEWLGEVPSHWGVVQLRRVLTSIEQGSSPLASANPPDAGESGVLKISAIKSGVFRELEAKSLDNAPFEDAYRVHKGDLLLTRGNTPDLVADSCVIREEPKANLMMSDLIYRLKVSDLANARFLCLWLLSTCGRLQIKSDARGSSMSMVKVAQGHIKAWLTTLPPP